MLSDHMAEKVERANKAAEPEEKEKMEAFLENANIFRLVRPAEKATLNAAIVGTKESSDTHTHTHPIGSGVQQAPYQVGSN